MKTPGQRGPFGAWLAAERTARYKTQRDALDAMRKLAGLHIAESEYAQWESGSRVPRDDNPKVARLYDFFGSRPGTAPEAPVEGSDEVLELARERNAIMREQLAEMRRQNDILLAMLGVRTRAEADPAREYLEEQLAGYQPDVLPQPLSDPTPNHPGTQER